MSSAAISFVSSPNSLSLAHVFRTKTNPIFSCRVPRFRPQSLSSFFIRIPFGSFKKPSFLTSSNRFSPVMKWQDCSVKMEIDVPASVAYNLYSDREAIPNWMPFVSSVKASMHLGSGYFTWILEFSNKPDLSRWFVKYEAFGRSIEYSWLAKNLQPIPNQKIHWTSLEGLGNRGSVRFYPKGPSSCLIVLSISYEVPQLLIPVASLLQPFMENLLKQGMDRFAKFAKSSSSTR
ncbi:peroxidase 5-like [Hibiscus syriacus]|uniref:Peroxidase 5-like n=1 Tax=Hibiscus syriacus TaxID=106335 RepID=A0A6A2Y0N5_HIBSY|nr:peroxidase 5-like [Hibiscus syriacus]